MTSASGRIRAAVDVGSNSVHLLVARAEGARPVHLRDESVLLGLGEVVDRLGYLPPGSSSGLTRALLAYRDTARRDGAESVTFVATEPLRRSSNAAEVAAEVRAVTGLPLHVLSAEAEAQLTYLGVLGREVVARPTLVVDIGGGSSEIVLALPGQRLLAYSLPSGSARLSAGVVFHDPPTAGELDRLRLGAHTLVGQLPPAQIEAAHFVGGTATNLAKIVPLSTAGLEQANELLTTLAGDELVERYVVNARRARQLPAGAAIVAAIFSRFGLRSAEVSQASLRDGAIAAADALGEAWPDGLEQLVGSVSSAS